MSGEVVTRESLKEHLLQWLIHGFAKNPDQFPYNVEHVHWVHARELGFVDEYCHLTTKGLNYIEEDDREERRTTTMAD